MTENTLLKREKMSRIQKLALLGVILLSFVLAFYYVYSYLYSESFGHDEGYYVEMARRWAEEGIYGYNSAGPNAFVPPGLPLYLLGCYKIFGFEIEGLICIRLMQLVFSVMTVFLVYVYGLQLTGRHNVGIIAAGLIACNLSFYSFTFSLLTENIYFLSMMVFAVVFTYTRRQEKLWLHFLSGLLFCGCVMIRSAIVAVLPLLYIPIFIENKGERGYAIKRFGLFMAGFVLLALPWWIRNAVVLDELILFCKQEHIVYAGFAPSVEELEAKGILLPGDAMGHFSALAQIFKADPMGTIYWFTFGKFENIFIQYEMDMFSVISAFFRCITVFFGFAVCVRGLGSKKYRWSVMTFLLYVLIIFMGVPTSRYGLQFLFFLAVAAAWLLDKLFLAKMC